MPILILGLVLFLGVHSIRIFADGVRTRLVVRAGLNAYKGVYSLIAIAGFILIIWGFGLARATPVMLYAPPMWLKHLNALFTLIAFVLVFAAHTPPNHFRSAIHHPMAAGVKVWALGHLLATGMLRDVVLFGAFLVWAIVDFAVSRRRDRIEHTSYPPGTAKGDVITVAVGVVAWAIFAFWLHRAWIGVDPFA